MAKEIRQIGVLTSGGDAPGMNAAIRAVAREAMHNKCKVIGIQRGYKGLLNEEFHEMKSINVAGIIHQGGTVLGTARCPEFKEEEVQQKAADICNKHGIDGIVVIGGDGSYRGAQALSRHGINTIGIPGTIDLDITCTDYTIGFDTAVNTAMEAIDKVKDTSSSHERCSIIEVMGRHAGYIALWCGIANGAEDILIPEKYDYDEQKIVDHIIMNRRIGKKHHLIINAEWARTRLTFWYRARPIEWSATRTESLSIWTSRKRFPCPSPSPNTSIRSVRICNRDSIMWPDGLFRPVLFMGEYS